MIGFLDWMTSKSKTHPFMYTEGERERKRKRKKERMEERDACRNCGWDGAAESCSTPSAVWAQPLGDTARRGRKRASRQD